VFTSSPQKFRLVPFALILVLTVFPLLVSAEPQIRHFYPEQPVLLGQPIFWLVEIRHPLWESYDLRFGACPDLKVSVADKIVSEVAGEMRTLYRVCILPTALKPGCTPALTISDQKGQTSVLNGKPLSVQTISGASEQIKEPGLPTIRMGSVNRRYGLYVLMIAIVLLSAVAIGKRIYNNTPAQRFLRDLRKARTEVTKDRLPIQIWRLLRSHMVWGFTAEALTPMQLAEKGTSDPRLAIIANTLQSLEAWRYSGTAAHWDRGLITQALTQAEELIRSKSLLHRWRSV
jgi:hypothetical protein